MKLNRTHIFIAVSSLALLVVLIIQVNWIVQAAKIKEELFNERANIVLSKTAESLSRDKETFRKLQISVGNSEAHKIDSLFTHYMKLYNIHIDYFFEVKPLPASSKNEMGFSQKTLSFQPGSYSTCVSEDSSKNDLELKLVFPGKRQFIVAEMGPMFITSVMLILVVLVLSLRTILSLMKQKILFEHTTDFLNNMTHEFKTPLTNIALAGKMMIRDTNIGQEDKVKHFSAIILEENEKLRLQVEQVLSMTALEKGEIRLQKTELDMHHLINDVLRHMSVQVESRQGTIGLDLAAHNIVLIGDKTHLTNALSNLVDNAIKYSEGAPQLSITTINANHNIVVMIADKGVGIEKAYKDKVFEKFFRIPTGDVHDVKGFGLGLAYVKKICELHGGTIDLKSEKGAGTTFAITLPYA